MRMILSLRWYLVDLRNDYALLYDQLNKNLERIRMPRGHDNGAVSMLQLFLLTNCHLPSRVCLSIQHFYQSSRL